ncbi:MAG: hypothetical protein ACK5Y2_13025 [Bdellovibrionales bacterium]
MKTKLLMIGALGFSLATEARVSRSEQARRGNAMGNQIGSQISNDSQQGQSTTGSNHASLQTSANHNVNNSQRGQAVSTIMFGALGAAAQKQWAVCGSGGYPACIAAGVLVGMAVQSKKSADSYTGPIQASRDNACEFQGGSGCGPNTNPYDPVVRDGPRIPEPRLAQIRNELDKKGIKVDSKGRVTLPDGQQVDASNPSSLEAALGADGASKLMAEVRDIEKDALARTDQVKTNTATAGFESGGGGELGTIAGYDEVEAARQAAALGRARARGPAQVSGLSKNFNGDPIGVAGDSIFVMMSRRYQLKNSQNTFLGAESN